MKTRYYDADKEAFEKRVEMAQWEADNPEHPAIQFRKHWEKNGRQRANQGSSRRIIVIAGALFALVYSIYRFL